MLRYVVEGQGIPALVPGSSIYYPRTFSAALRQQFELAFMDLRHFAQPDPSQAVNVPLDAYLDDIDRVRKTLGFTRCVLIGHSHHGNLALAYAHRHPEAISHVVLICSPPCGVPETIESGQRYWNTHASEDRKAVLRDNWQRLGAGTLATLPPGEAFVAEYVADGPRYWHEARYDASWIWEGVPINMALIPAFRGFFANFEMLDLRVPILAVAGRDDYAVPPTLWNSVRRNGVCFQLFEHSGHTPQLEESARFDRTLIEWIQHARTDTKG